MGPGIQPGELYGESKVLSVVKKFLPDIAAVIGFLCLVVGCTLAWVPLGWIVGGSLLLAAALVGHFRGRRQERRGEHKS